MIFHENIENCQIGRLIRGGQITFGGNGKLKIYGLLTCQSGKRMLKKNRVFFSTEQEAIDHGYRPCGHCMREAYRHWKNQQPTGQIAGLTSKPD